MYIKNQHRLDNFLVANSLVKTRQRAQELIKMQGVLVNGEVVTKKSYSVKFNDKVEIKEEIMPYVSRGGLKLAAALKEFQINVREKVCLDIGASTGGFTDCLLQNGARLVYAVDVGENQLHESLKNDARVKSFEKTDVRFFDLPAGQKTNETERVDFICLDLSFISLKLILPVLKKFLRTDGDIVALFKPQFESGLNQVNKRGIVFNQKKIAAALEEFVVSAREEGFIKRNLCLSPILGKNGNQEYLIHLQNKK